MTVNFCKALFPGAAWLESTLFRATLFKSTPAIVYAMVVCTIAVLSGCGDVEFEPRSSVPLPLIEPFPASVGIYFSEDLRKFVHTEERWGSDWKATLGADHEKLLTQLFGRAFRRAVPVEDRKLAAESGLSAVLQPVIEQYSFITPRDTGGRYFAVTIKYRLEVYAPDGRLADTLSFTGYGSAPAGTFFSAPAIQKATQAAMRDAAAKFLVQFPEQTIAKKLRAGEPLVAAAPAGTGDTEFADVEPVPIIDTPTPN